MSYDHYNINTINEENFENIALQLFKKQYNENKVYRAYLRALRIDANSISTIFSIPFLPISFFKTHNVICGEKLPELLFKSSGTTGDVSSKHYVVDESIYEHALLKGFEHFYGDAKKYVILALLPSYLERKNASLVHMAQLLMYKSGHSDNGFYLNEWVRLQETILRLEKQQQKILLLGVTFALLDFAEKYSMNLQYTTVMETGGMKGRKKEMTRVEVHDFLKKQWELDSVHSEYGMTELLSQAYAKRDGIFCLSPTMKVFVRDMNDPFEIKTEGIGYLNVIDLANVHSCSFIATEDIGKLYSDGSFEVLGRMDHSALRGCSLMTV